MRTLVVTTACAVWASGCVSGRQGLAHSPLTGTWENTDDPGDTLVIQPDGTFDFTRTMLAMAGDVSGLRKAGDRLKPAPDGATFEITDSEFTASTSYVRFKSTLRIPEGGEEVEWAAYQAHLEPDGRLALHAGRLPRGDARPESLPVQLYRRIGDAPPRIKPRPAPEPAKDEWIAIGRRQFASENWFEKLRAVRLSSGVLNSVLLMPRDEVQARRLLVVRVDNSDEIFFEGALAECAADAAKVGCSILCICIPELSGARRTDAARVAELAQQVLARTGEALERLHPKSVAWKPKSMRRPLGTTYGKWTMPHITVGSAGTPVLFASTAAHQT